MANGPEHIPSTESNPANAGNPLVFKLHVPEVVHKHLVNKVLGQNIDATQEAIKPVGFRDPSLVYFEGSQVEDGNMGIEYFEEAHSFIKEDLKGWDFEVTTESGNKFVVKKNKELVAFNSAGEVTGAYDIDEDDDVAFTIGQPFGLDVLTNDDPIHGVTFKVVDDERSARSEQEFEADTYFHARSENYFKKADAYLATFHGDNVPAPDEPTVPSSPTPAVAKPQLLLETATSTPGKWVQPIEVSAGTSTASTAEQTSQDTASQPAVETKSVIEGGESRTDEWAMPKNIAGDIAVDEMDDAELKALGYGGFSVRMMRELGIKTSGDFQKYLDGQSKKLDNLFEKRDAWNTEDAAKAAEKGAKSSRSKRVRNLGNKAVGFFKERSTGKSPERKTGAIKDVMLPADRGNIFVGKEHSITNYELDEDLFNNPKRIHVITTDNGNIFMKYKDEVIDFKDTAADAYAAIPVASDMKMPKVGETWVNGSKNTGKVESIMLLSVKEAVTPKEKKVARLPLAKIDQQAINIKLLYLEALEQEAHRRELEEARRAAA